jgi:hypothetical protein
MYQPKDNAELGSLIDLCRQRRLYSSGARRTAEVLVVDTKLAGDGESSVRYNAACLALLGAAGQGEDAASLDQSEQAQLRRKAVEWLRADVTLWTKQLESGEPASRAKAQRMLRHSHHDTDLAGIRDPAALAKLPEAERKACQAFWAEVETLLKKVQ